MSARNSVTVSQPASRRVIRASSFQTLQFQVGAENGSSDLLRGSLTPRKTLMALKQQTGRRTKAAARR